jgi:hypothetical protein
MAACLALSGGAITLREGSVVGDDGVHVLIELGYPVLVSGVFAVV